MTRVPDVDDATHATHATRFRPVGPAIMRIAGWPIETISALQSSELAARIDEWIREDEDIRRESEDLARRLHEIIPRIGDRNTRRRTLELKRHLHGTTRPPPELLVAGLLADERVRESLACALAAAVGRRCAHAAERDKIDQAHAAEIGRARGELDRLTGDDRFLRALCVASPSTFRQWQAELQRPSGGRKRERLQGTLHRYLMRAVGRATPNGLWAGIALEDIADPVRAVEVQPAASVTRVSPALAVFARALETMNRRRPWIESVPLRLNPTVRRVSHEVWELGTFEDGCWCFRRIASHPAVEALIAAVSPADRLFVHEIESRLVRTDPTIGPAEAMTFADALLEVGLLWSTATIPPIYANTWQALDAIIETLPPSEVPPWQQCRATLAGLARDIEARIDLIDPNALRTQLDEARRAANAVFARYGVTAPDGQDVLVLDRTAPFRFSLSPGLATNLEQTIRAYWCFDRFGLGEIERRVGLAQVFGAIPDRSRVRLHDFLSRGSDDHSGGGTQSWEDRVLSKATGENAARARDAFARWEEEIEPAFARPTHGLEIGTIAKDAVLPPGSALFLLGMSRGNPVLRLGGITPEPCFFHARFSHLFGSDEGAPDRFLEWHRAGIRRIESRWPQLQFCDLAIRNHRNPNVTARPRTASRLIDPLDGGKTLREVAIAYGRDGYPMLAAAEETALLVPSARSAAYLAGLDRFASILASVSVFLGRPALLAPMPRFSREITTWRHLPRLLLADTAISPERWTPPDELGQSLAKAEAAERFILWRRFARTAGLPEFVHAFHGQHQTESLLATDSALAIDFLGQELKAHGPALRLQELFPPPGQFLVRDEDGKGYLAELAVAWQGDPEFWKAYVEAGSADGGEC